MKLLIDERIRKIEYEYLKKYFEVVKLPLSEDVYEEISGHSDVFYTKIDEEIICSPNSKIIDSKFIMGKEKVGNTYPEDVKYNICQIGQNIIGSKYVDSSLRDKINVLVKQGYTKCNICVTSKNSCITTDIGIYRELKKHNIDAIFIKNDNIHLLKRNGTISKMKGFIGGASIVVNNTFILFGDINYIEDNSKKEIENHLLKYNLKLKDFKGLEIIDYGGCIMYN